MLPLYQNKNCSDSFNKKGGLLFLFEYLIPSFSNPKADEGCLISFQP